MITRMIRHLKNRHNISKKRAEIINILSQYQSFNNVNQIEDEKTYKERLKFFGKMMREGASENILSAEAKILDDYDNSRLSDQELDFIRKNIKDGYYLALVFFAVGSDRGKWCLLQDLGDEYLRSVIRNSDHLIWILRTIPDHFASNLFEKITVGYLQSLINDSEELLNILKELSFDDREKLTNQLISDYKVNSNIKIC